MCFIVREKTNLAMCFRIQMAENVQSHVLLPSEPENALQIGKAKFLAMRVFMTQRPKQIKKMPKNMLSQPQQAARY